jgi:hypothetical protein
MPGWYEIVIEGAAKAARAFVIGFMAGREVPHAVFIGDDLALEPASLGERLRELLTAGSHHVFLVPEHVAAPLEAAIRACGADVGLCIERSGPIDSVGYTFRAEAYSKDVAADIRAALIAARPPDVRIEDLSEDEERHPEAHGAEPFAPLHEYIYRASGRIVGPPDAVIPMYRDARTRDFVEISALHIYAQR